MINMHNLSVSFKLILLTTDQLSAYLTVEYHVKLILTND